MTSVGQPAERQTTSKVRDQVLPLLVAAGIVLALAVVVVLTRLYRLSDTPPGIINDEGANGVDALQVLQGEHAVFFAEKASGREAIAIYATALATRLLGPSLLAFHLPGALASAFTVFIAFWLGLLLSGRDEDSGLTSPWRGLTIAGIGAGLLAASIGQTFLARGGFRANFLPMILSLSLALLWWAWDRENRRGVRWWRFALAGACAGLLPYTYIPARFTPLLFFFLGLSFLIPFDSTSLGKVRAVWPKAVVFTSAALLVAAPILFYFVLHPEDFLFRSQEILLSRDSKRTPFGAFLKNVGDYMLLFGFQGDRNLEYNFSGRPYLNPWEAVFFWTGVGVSLWHWRRRPSNRLLLIWLGVMLLPAMLSYNKGFGPNSLRIIGAAPAVFLLVGVGAWEIARLLTKPFLTRNKVGFATVLGILVACLVLLQGALTFRSFFHDWVGTPDYYAAADAEIAEAAKALNALPPDADAVNLLPYSLSNGHYGFDYLYHGPAAAHVIHATMTHLPQNVEAILAAKEELTEVRVVDWNDDLTWIGGGEEHTVALLGKYGTLLGSETFPFFQIHTYTDIDLDSNWTFYDQIGPPVVHYDGGISLLGFALGYGNAQYSTLQAIDLGAQRSFWIVLRWQTAPRLDIEYALSLRLHNEEGVGVFQQDIVLLDPQHTRTSNWAPDQPVETLYHIEIPANLDAGEYDLRLIVYDFATLKPTVELGVWESEAELAMLQVEERR